MKYVYIVNDHNGNLDRVFQGIETARGYVKRCYSGTSSSEIICSRRARANWVELWDAPNGFDKITIEKHIVY